MSATVTTWCSSDSLGSAHPRPGATARTRRRTGPQAASRPSDTRGSSRLWAARQSQRRSSCRSRTRTCWFRESIAAGAGRRPIAYGFAPTRRSARRVVTTGVNEPDGARDLHCERLVVLPGGRGRFSRRERARSQCRFIHAGSSTGEIGRRLDGYSSLAAGTRLREGHQVEERRGRARDHRGHIRSQGGCLNGELRYVCR